MIVEVEVNPTESADRVAAAVRNILGDITLKTIRRGDGAVLQGRLQGAKPLSHFRNLLRRSRIRGAARAFLTRRSEPGTLMFGLNKQAAFVGRLSFYHAREAPLGPITITFKGDVDEAIEYLCESVERR